MLLPYTPERKEKLFIWSFHHCPQIRTSVLAATIYTGKNRKLFIWSFHHCPQIRTSVLAATIFEDKKRASNVARRKASLILLLPYTRKRKRKFFFWSFHHCPQIRISVLAATIYRKKREALLLELPSLPADKDFCPCCYHIQGKEPEALLLELPSLPADKHLCFCCYHIRGKNKKLFIWSFHHCPQIRTSVLAATTYTEKKREALHLELPSLPADKDFCPCCYHIHRKEKGSSSFGASIVARR